MAEERTVLVFVFMAVAALSGGLLGGIALDSWVWGTVLAVLFALAVFVGVNLWLKKRLEAVFRRVQEALTSDQTAMKRQLERMQSKMGGVTKGLQKQLEKKQTEGLRSALQMLDEAAPLARLNFLIERQLATMRAQLHFQMREFEEADKYLEKAMAFDSFTMAIKMVRSYKREETERLDKLFKKAAKRFKKDEDAELVHAVYSWILVKTDRVDEAVELLANAKEKIESDLIKRNWEHLANGRTKRFSNASLGDRWYALHLETPKPVKQRAAASRRRFR